MRKNMPLLRQVLPLLALAATMIKLDVKSHAFSLNFEFSSSPVFILGLLLTIFLVLLAQS